jgi:hypothetical protein
LRIPVKVSELLLHFFLCLLHLLAHLIPKWLDLVAELVACVANGLQESIPWVGS